MTSQDQGAVTPASEPAQPGQWRIAANTAGEVVLCADDAFDLEAAGGGPRLKFRPIKRRVQGRIRAWIQFLESVNDSNALEQEAEVYRCADELAEILRSHVMDWSGFVGEGGRELPFAADALDDLIDDGEVIHIAGLMFAASMAGPQAKKRSGSPSPSSSQAAGGLKLAAEGSPQPGPTTTPSPSSASGVTADTAGGGGGSTTDTDGPRQASSSPGPIAPPPLLPLNPASG